MGNFSLGLDTDRR